MPMGALVHMGEDIKGLYNYCQQTVSESNHNEPHIPFVNVLIIQSF